MRAAPRAALAHFRRWGMALSDGLIQGFSSPALGLAIQAQLPVQALAQPQATTLNGASA